MIEKLLNARKKRELFIIYLATFMIIFYLVYSQIYPKIDKSYKKINSELFQIRSTLKVRKNLYSQKVFQNNIYDIKDLKTKLSNLKNQNIYLSNKLFELSKCLSSNREVNNFINDLSSGAKKYSIDIDNVKNNLMGIGIRDLYKISKITVVASGKFYNILRFINYLEREKFLVDISTINMELNRKINLKLTIYLWGFRY